MSVNDDDQFIQDEIRWMKKVIDSKIVEKLKGAHTLVKHRDDMELLQVIQEKGIEAATSRKSSSW